MEYKIACVLLFVICTKVFGANSECTSGVYYHQNGVCVPCSVCSESQVALRLCHNDKDTVCGVIEGFRFVQWPLPSSKSKVTEDLTTVFAERQQLSVTAFVTEQQGDDKWFIITMVLVGIIVLTTVIGVVMVLVMCYVCKRKQREIIYDPAYTHALLKDYSPNSASKIEQFKVVFEK